jgi:hypothetical protein
MQAEALSTKKVLAEHLERKAYVYVRQSTFYQVENNLESQRRRYGLAEEALQLGWSRELVVVIDEDQGRSGSCANQRSGFGRLVTAVGLGEVGIVMSLEASRRRTASRALAWLSGVAWHPNESYRAAPLVVQPQIKQLAAPQWQ